MVACNCHRYPGRVVFGDIMTISKYEQTLADQSRHIIESSDIMKPVLDKIKDLDKEVTNNVQFWRD